jgi:hypothetical protein
MLRIRELIVSSQQEEHIWVKHQITPDEVEEICQEHRLVLRGRDGSYAVYGQTDAGRYLVAFLYPRGRDVFALATAREMTQVERRRVRGIRDR